MSESLPWEEWKKRGNDRFKAKEYSEAVDCYSHALAECKPEHRPTLLTNRAMAKFRDKDFKGVVKDAGVALEGEPTRVKAFYWRGLAHEQLGLLEAARDDLQRAVELDAGNQAAVGALGRVASALSAASGSGSPRDDQPAAEAEPAAEVQPAIATVRLRFTPSDGAAEAHPALRHPTSPVSAQSRQGQAQDQDQHPHDPRRPPPAEQARMVKTLMEQSQSEGLEEGDEWFVVGIGWWERWGMFSGFLDEDEVLDDSAGVGEEDPGPVANAPLLDEETGRLRPGLALGRSFVLVPAEVWDALQSWYGGGPPVARAVVMDGDEALGNRTARVELYPELAAAMEAARSPAEPAEPAEPPSQTETAAPPDHEHCGACGLPTSGNRCSRCKAVVYCGRGCQVSHWKFHKGVCRPGEVVVGRRGRAGLSNLGNTCYMNSALQCLSHAMPLTRYMLGNRHRAERNPDNVLGTGCRVVDEWEAVLKQLWLGAARSVTPGAFKHTVGRVATQFAGFQQHDSQDFLAWLLDALHEDLNRVVDKPYVETVEGDGRPDAEVAAEAWERHLQRNQSVIVDNFYGQFKSTVVCPTCDRVSITFDPFNVVTLEMPGKNLRKFKVQLMRQRGGFRTAYGVAVKTSQDARAIKRQLAQLSGASADDLVLTRVQRGKITQVVSDRTPAARLPSGGTGADLVAYELAEDDDWTSVMATHDVAGMYPTVASVPPGASCMEVREAVWALVRHLVAPSASASAAGLPLYGANGEPVPASDEPAADVMRMRTTVQLNVVWEEWAGEVDLARELVRKVKLHRSVESVRAGGPGDGPLTLAECFAHFTTAETLDEANEWYCSNCKSASKQMAIWRLPKVLVVSLKRFEYRNMLFSDKLDGHVAFPLEGLDPRPFCLPGSAAHASAPLYDLFAVANHFGNMGFGHYTAYAREMRPGGARGPWYNFDDSSCSLVSEDRVCSSAAYILFYVARE